MIMASGQKRVHRLGPVPVKPVGDLRSAGNGPLQAVKRKYRLFTAGRCLWTYAFLGYPRTAAAYIVTTVISSLPHAFEGLPGKLQQ